MDNFFAKKGLTMARQHQPFPPSRSPQQFPHSETHINSQPYMYHPSNQPLWNNNMTPFQNVGYNKPPENHYQHQTYSYIPYQSNQNIYEGPTSKRQTVSTHKRNLSQYENSVSKSSFQQFKEMQAQYTSISTQDKTPKNAYSIDQNGSMKYISTANEEHEPTNRSMGKIQLKNNDQPTKIKQIKDELLNVGKKDRISSQINELPGGEPPLLKGIKSFSTFKKNSTNMEKTDTFERKSPVKIAKTERETYNPTIPIMNNLRSSDTLNHPNQMKTSATLGETNNGGSSSYWIEQKIKLLRQIEEKDKKIIQLENKVTTVEQQYKSKIIMLQYQKRKAEGLKNRAELQIDNARKLLQLQKGKNDDAQNKIDKLMFFQDDLIHARDYNRLKSEMQQVLTQNAKMFQQHQQYIIEVATNRRQVTNRLEQIELELNLLKKETIVWRQKIENISVSSEDKVQLVKMQTDINFLMKKGEQLMESMRERQNNLEKAHLHIKKLTQNQNRRVQSEKNVLDEFNFQHLGQTIAKYESRISDLNEILQTKSMELDKQKVTIDYLFTELRKSREDSKISSLKERSAQNSLKNELTVIQHNLQTEIHLQAKKIASLEDKVARKTKQVIEKDNFIKDYLIRRVKDVDKNTVDELIKNIKNYFVSETPPASQTEIILEKEIKKQSKETQTQGWIVEIQKNSKECIKRPENIESETSIKEQQNGNVSSANLNVDQPINIILKPQLQQKEVEKIAQIVNSDHLQNTQLTKQSTTKEINRNAQDNLHKTQINKIESKLYNSANETNENQIESQLNVEGEMSSSYQGNNEQGAYEVMNSDDGSLEKDSNQKLICNQANLGTQGEQQSQQSEQFFEQPIEQPELTLFEQTTSSQIDKNALLQNQ